MKYEHARLLISGRTPQDLLADRIRSDGLVVGNALKVNTFLNHQVDTHLMSVCGHELARRFKGVEVTKVVTGTGSGLMPAQSCALHMSVPLVFATDVPPMTRAPGVPVYAEEIVGSSVPRDYKKLHISSEFIGPEDRVVIIDDMLSKGSTAACIACLVSKAGGKVVGACVWSASPDGLVLRRALLVGCGFMIEKTFEGGRQRIADQLQLPRQRIQALVTIHSISPEGGIEIGGEGGFGSGFK